MNGTEWRIILQRIPLLLSTLATLVSLSGLIDLDTHYLHSVAFLIIYASVCFVQLALIIFRKKLTTSELYVYSVMLVCAFAINTVYFQDQYEKGFQSRKDFITNMVGLVIAVVAEIYQVARDCRSPESL